MIQAGLHWVSGGKEFKVYEIACISNGAPTCEFIIYKDPVPSPLSNAADAHGAKPRI